MPRRDALLRLTSRLIARRDDLRRSLDSDLNRVRGISVATGVGDPVDAAVDAATDEISSQLAEIETRELDRIERALERIAARSYGRCEFCGAKISATRLNALPDATSCIDCQREAERRASSKSASPTRQADAPTPREVSSRKFSNGDAISP